MSAAVLLVLAPLAYAQFPPLTDLSSTTADVTVLGAEAHARAAYALASGDFNGDGLVDLVVSSDGLFPLDGARAGEYDIVWGEAIQNGGTVDLSNSTGVSRIFGLGGGFPLFCSLSSGDFNSDGFDDIIIGEPAADSYSGLVHILLGSATFPDTLDLQLHPSNVITMGNLDEGAWLGFESCSGDVDGDGYDDMLISAPSIDYGEVYIVRGAPSFPSFYDLTEPHADVTRIIDDNYLQFTGRDLACRDIDRDGYDDVLIGSPGQIYQAYRGIVTLVYGDAILPDTISLLNTSFRVKRLFGEPGDPRLGNYIAIADVDEDGAEDLVLTAPYADPLGCLDCGEVYIVYDAESLPDSIVVSTLSHPITRIIGSRYSTSYGLEVLCADLSGDGYADVVLRGEYVDNVEASRDTVVVYYGGESRPDTVFLATDTTVSRIVADNYRDDLGGAMTSGDYNNDGCSDLALGAYAYQEGASVHVGRAYIFYGNPDTPTPVLIEGFAAQRLAIGVRLTWTVHADEAIRGFDVYRQDGDKPWRRINAERLPQSASHYLDDSARADQAHAYALVVIKLDGSELRSQPTTVDAARFRFAIERIYPNPFNPTTTISYTLPKAGNTELGIYNTTGTLVRVLERRVIEAGPHSAVWDGHSQDGSPTASGVYFVRLKSGDDVRSRKIILLK